FVAWHGLSSAYRKAVDGHCPWKPGDRDPAPIFVDDIDKTGEPEELKAAVRAENIRGLGFVPLVGAGGAIGKFMLYYEQPHVFAPEETELAVAIARQLGFSLDRWQSERMRQAADELRARLAAIVESSD